MKVFYNRTFYGHYPVGTSAVVVADDAAAAAELLEVELRYQGLAQRVYALDMFELEMKPQAVVLQNGDY